MMPHAMLQPIVAIRSSRAPSRPSSWMISPAPSVNVSVMIRPNRTSPRLVAGSRYFSAIEECATGSSPLINAVFGSMPFVDELVRIVRFAIVTRFLPLGQLHLLPRHVLVLHAPQQ